jgi:hypothetical protein
MGSVPRDRLGIAGSLNAFFRNLGMVTGTTLSVSLFSLVTKARMDSVSSGALDGAVFLGGFRVVVIAAAGFALVAMVGEVLGKKGGAAADGAAGRPAGAGLPGGGPVPGPAIAAEAGADPAARAAGGEAASGPAGHDA